MQKTWFKVTIALIAFLTLLTVFLVILDKFVFKPVKNPVYGVTFVKERSQEYGLDWRANYLALLDDLKIPKYRLVSYWSDIETERGKFDFTDLDWQMDEAAKRGAKVSLSIGVRQPRWPECHEPGWAHLLGGHEWKQALYAYMEIVIDRYKNHPALESYQLENEAVNNWFGTCKGVDRVRLVEEFNFVRKWDPNHPIYMSLSDQHGLPVRGPTPDKFGYSVYRWVWNEKVPPQGYIVYPTPLWYHRLRAVLIELLKDREIFIHELQMEPWGQQDTSKLSIAEQDKSMSAEQIPKNFDFGRRIGSPDIFLWGGEWWYWRKVNGDPKIWETVRQQLQAP